MVSILRLNFGFIDETIKFCSKSTNYEKLFTFLAFNEHCHQILICVYFSLRDFQGTFQFHPFESKTLDGFALVAAYIGNFQLLFKSLFRFYLIKTNQIIGKRN